MKEDFISLKKEFRRIKNMGLIETMRKGGSGIGYTLETLLNKKEDQECKPDFKSIELKSRMGYSKHPLNLFHCAPKRNKNTAIDYIFQTYNYPKHNEKDILIFDRTIYSKKAIKKYNYEFKLKVDYFFQQIVMQSFCNNIFIEDVCTWDFKVLENKLKKKLQRLAIIYAYPYKRDNKMYYKYVKMEFYKLKGFFEFLKLIEDDKIHVDIYLKQRIDKEQNYYLENHGVAFKIDFDAIENLFYKYYF